MNRFEKVLEIEKAYRKKADATFKSYQKEESAARKRLTPQSFELEFIQDRWVQIAGKFRAETESTVREISGIFEELRGELKDWMMKPVQPGILETLRCIRDFGLRLSLQELKVIGSEISESYLTKKIFASIAKDSGFHAECVDISELLSTLDTAQSIVESRIRAYAGKGGNEGFPGRDLIDHKVIDGIDWGEYSLIEMSVASVERSDTLDCVKNLFEKARAPIHYTLTEEESKNIAEKLDPLIDRWNDIDKKGLDKVREEIPDILSRLESMPDSYEHKETFKKYLLLNHMGEKNQPETDGKDEPESLLDVSSAVELAKKYTDQHGTVNMDILNQY